MSVVERTSALRRFVPSIRNVVAGYAGTVAEALVFLLLTPFLVRKLGIDEYGLWGVGVALAEWVQFLDPGLREALMKYVAAHQARAEAVLVRRTADTALHLYLIVRLGVTSPPWSKEAADRPADPEPTPPRSGLVQPAPRAAGVRRRPSE